MITLFLAHFATTLARFGKQALATWHEAQQLRREMSGRSEE